jgi:hypothetical protein
MSRAIDIFPTSSAGASLGLPTAPPKKTDNRAFTGETCQAEAIASDDLARIVEEAIRDCTDMEIYQRVLEQEKAERAELMERLK